MTPKTPVGPSVCCALLTPPQACGDRSSKKYAHSSGLAPTNATDALGARASLSHSTEIRVDFLRLEPSF